MQSELAVQYSKTEYQRIYLAALIWGVDLIGYVKAVVMRLPLLNLFSAIFIPAVIIVSIFVCLPGVSRKIRKGDIIFFVLCLAVYLSQFLLFPENDEALSEHFPIVFFSALPMYFIGLIIDTRQSLKVLEYVSTAYILIGAFYFFFFTIPSSDVETTGERMGMAYAYLPHVLLILYATLRDFRLYKLLTLLVGVLILLGTGNRGSLALVCMFIAFYLLFCSRNINKLRLTVVCLIVLAIGLLFWNQIVNGLINILDTLGLNTRALMMLVDSDFLDDNGRSELYVFIMEKIRVSGFFGYGICGDRLLLRYLNNPYPHNILTEILIQFGVPLGSLLITALVIIMYKAFRKCDDSCSRAFFFILFVTGFLSLFISDSYLRKPFFFLFLGYCINRIRTI